MTWKQFLDPRTRIPTTDFAAVMTTVAVAFGFWPLAAVHLCLETWDRRYFA